MKTEIENWNWKLKTEIENWNWKLKLKIEIKIENKNWKLKLKIKIEYQDTFFSTNKSLYFFRLSYASTLIVCDSD